MFDFYRIDDDLYFKIAKYGRLKKKIMTSVAELMIRLPFDGNQ